MEQIPQIGDIRYGRELGFKDCKHKYKWRACAFCGRPRWVRPDQGTTICQRCNYQNPRRHDNHPHWKGGQTTQLGYIVIKSPDHPNRDANGDVKRCRLVLEQALGCTLPRTIDVHHINGIRTDDRLENLMSLSHSDHMRLHALQRHQEQKARSNV